LYKELTKIIFRR